MANLPRPSLKGVRKIDGLNRQSTAVLDHDDVDERPEEIYRAGSGRLADRQMPVPKRVLRRVTPAEEFDDESGNGFLRSQTRIRVRRGLIPESLWGRILAGCAVFILICAVVAGMLVVRNFLLHDSRFVIDSSSDIQINGNSHVSRPQLLSIFGEDISRNLFYVPLAARRAELEQLPWVEHATVMRLLPNRLRVSVVERTPVAFVRQDGRIGLADAYGVLLDLPTDDVQSSKYSFPVLTGIAAADPLSTRAARMKIYMQFIKELDSSGPKLSETLSEVDVSNPEDVKALIPDHSTEILVHFGDEDFLERYQRYQQQLPAWRAQYPRLAAVDMRYQNQSVLTMATGADASSATPDAGTTTNGTGAATVAVPAEVPPPAPVTDPASGKKSAAVPMVVTPKTVAPSAAVAKTTASPAAKTAPVVVKTAAPVIAKAAAPAAAKSVTPAVKTAQAAAPKTTAVAKTTAPKSAGVTPAATAPTHAAATAPAKTATAPPALSLQHPLMQAYDVPAKKPVAKAKAKPSAKGKPVVVKSKTKAATPAKPSPAQAD